MAPAPLPRPGWRRWRSTCPWTTQRARSQRWPSSGARAARPAAASRFFAHMCICNVRELRGACRGSSTASGKRLWTSRSLCTATVLGTPPGPAWWRGQRGTRPPPWCLLLAPPAALPRLSAWTVCRPWKVGAAWREGACAGGALSHKGAAPPHEPPRAPARANPAQAPGAPGAGGPVAPQHLPGPTGGPPQAEAPGGGWGPLADTNVSTGVKRQS